MKVYDTKKPLTNGIRLVEVVETRIKGMLQVVGRKDYYLHGEGKHWHRTLDAAIKRATKLQNAKIKSLEKSLEKIKNIKF